mgnify:CR=1 FL=1
MCQKLSLKEQVIALKKAILPTTRIKIGEALIEGVVDIVMDNRKLINTLCRLAEAQQKTNDSLMSDITEMAAKIYRLEIQNKKGGSNVD